MQKFYEEIDENKDWKQMLTHAEELIGKVIPEATDWEAWWQIVFFKNGWVLAPTILHLKREENYEFTFTRVKIFGRN